MIMTIRNLMALIMVTTGLFAQSVMGTVYDANSRPLEGANVVLVGTDLGDTANEAGAYSMISVPAGTYDLTASFIGYEPITKSIVVGEEDVMTHFILEVSVVALSDVEVLASRASDKTPVAFTNVSK
jgi:iron complex outermembrane receptor protein